MGNYDVTDSREVSKLTPGGDQRKVYRVWIRTVHGATGSVDISEADWTPDRIREILAETAEKLDRAFNL